MASTATSSIACTIVEALARHEISQIRDSRLERADGVMGCGASKALEANPYTEYAASGSPRWAPNRAANCRVPGLTQDPLDPLRMGKAP